MPEPDGARSLYLDTAAWEKGPQVDDFLVAIGKLKSNSVYHVAGAGGFTTPRPHVRRWHLRVYLSDLPMLVQRDRVQQVWPLHWYPRKKRTA